ncbi:MAG: hypothetical protein AB1589_23970 [Cyanobacteriota bacterium]
MSILLEKWRVIFVTLNTYVRIHNKKIGCKGQREQTLIILAIEMAEELIKKAEGRTQ